MTKKNSLLKKLKKDSREKKLKEKELRKSWMPKIRQNMKLKWLLIKKHTKLR
jgi:hypothetical protein